MTRIPHTHIQVLERFQGRSLSRLDAARKQPRRTPPTGAMKIDMRPIERAYRNELHLVVATLSEHVERLIIPPLVRGMQTQANFRDALAQPIPRLDSPQTDLDMASDHVRELMAGAFPNPKVNALAFGAFDRAQSLHAEQQAGQLRHNSIGLSLFQDTPDLAEQSRAFVRVNTRLIKSLPETSLDRIERVVSEGIRFGLRGTDVANQIVARDLARAQRKLAELGLGNQTDPETLKLAAQVEEELDIALRRADFIARDQIAKAQADLSRSRQTANGVTKFVWRTLGGERVRPHHVTLDGRTFTWERGASGLYPGQDPN